MKNCSYLYIGILVLICINTDRAELDASPIPEYLTDQRGASAEWFYEALFPAYKNLSYLTPLMWGLIVGSAYLGYKGTHENAISMSTGKSLTPPNNMNDFPMLINNDEILRKNFVEDGEINEKLYKITKDIEDKVKKNRSLEQLQNTNPQDNPKDDIKSKFGRVFQKKLQDIPPNLRKENKDSTIKDESFVNVNSSKNSHGTIHPFYGA